MDQKQWKIAWYFLELWEPIFTFMGGWSFGAGNFGEGMGYLAGILIIRFLKGTAYWKNVDFSVNNKDHKQK